MLLFLTRSKRNIIYIFWEACAYLLLLYIQKPATAAASEASNNIQENKTVYKYKYIYILLIHDLEVVI